MLPYARTDITILTASTSTPPGDNVRLAGISMLSVVSSWRARFGRRGKGYDVFEH